MRPSLLLAVLLLACSAGLAEAEPPSSESQSSESQSSESQSSEPVVVRAGDMLLFRDSLISPAPPDGVASDRSAAGFGFYSASPWPGRTVPVGFEASVSEAHRRRFFESCEVWSPLTGLRCVERSDERSWLTVTERGPGCSATVGAPLRGNGVFNFAEAWCWEPAAVVHDIGHVFGLIHEHQRPDRDTYVEVRSENIMPAFVYAYARIATGRVLSDYDFDSVMHYPPAAYSANGQAIMVPRDGYRDRARAMGLAQLPSRLDIEALVQMYNAVPRSRPDVPAPVAFTRADFLNAMEELDRAYVVELQRAAGLSINGRPDFVGIAAWIFDVYLSSRASGYTEGESLYNVRASISLSDEWRMRNPHLSPLPTLPTFSPIQLDRGEYVAVMARLDEAYRTELLRPDGLSLGGRPDFAGIAAWIFDVYLNARLDGRSIEDAWARVLAAIRASDEYRQKHPA